MESNNNFLSRRIKVPLKGVLLFFFVFLLSSVAIAQTTYYVAQTGGSDGNDGLTPATAFETLEKALRNPVLVSGDTVKVAEGTYKPTYIPSGVVARDATFMVNKSICLLGGYKSDFTTRDYITNHKTILSGDLTGNAAEKAFHTMVWIPLSTDLTQGLLDGFVIENGLADGAGSLPINGTNTSRALGAGLMYMKGKLQISNNKFQNNKSNGDGAGVYCIAGSAPTVISDNWFDNNESMVSGGGLALGAALNSCIIERNTFTNNTAATYGSGLYNANTSTGNITNVRFNTFVGNKAINAGAAFYFTGATRLFNNTFIGNEATNSSSAAVITSSNGVQFVFGNNIMLGNIAAIAPYDMGYSVYAPAITSEGFNTIRNAWANYIQSDKNDLIGIEVDQAAEMFDYTSKIGAKLIPVLTFIPGKLAPVVMPKNSVAANGRLWRIPAGNMNDVNTPKNSAGKYIDQTGNEIDISSGSYFAGSVSPAARTCPTSNVWYVDINTTNEGDASTPAAPTKDLAALLLSNCLKAGDTVKVAEGTYYTNTANPGESHLRAPTFYVNKSIIFRGGYTNTFKEADRDFVNNETILDGDFTQSGNAPANSLHVLLWTAINDTKTGIIDGFIIQNGTANDNSTFLKDISRAVGGGLLHHEGTLHILNTVFRNNISFISGAGAYTRANLMLVKGNYFYNNKTTYGVGISGAGLYYASVPKTSPLIEGNTFYQNSGASSGAGLGLGGGLGTTATFFIVKYNTFVENTSVNNNGGGFGSNSNTKVYNNTVIGNRALTGHGGVSLSPNTLISGNIIAGNESTSGLNNAGISGTLDNEGFNAIGTGGYALGANDYHLLTPDLLSIFPGKISSENENIYLPTLTNISGSVAPVVIPFNTSTAINMLRKVPVSALANNGIKNNDGKYVDQALTEINTNDLKGFYHMGSVNINATCPNNPGRIWYVDINAATDGDGSTPSTPTKDLSSLLVSLCLQVEDTIKVAAGTYIPNWSFSGVATYEFRDRAFYIDKSLVLLGGYDGTFNEATRNPISNRTILSGENLNDNNIQNNLFHVVVWNADKDNKKGIFEGFEVREGWGNGSGFIFNTIPRNMGAGFAHRAGRLRIHNNRFVQNSSSGGGGAVYIVSSNLEEFIANHIENNATTGGEAAGVYIGSDASTKIEMNTFTNNENKGTGAVGGLRINTTATTFFDIRNNTFTGNKAANGSAAYLTCYANVFNNTVIGNTVTGSVKNSTFVYAGAGMVYGGNIFAGNTATGGKETSNFGTTNANVCDNKGYNLYSFPNLTAKIWGQYDASVLADEMSFLFAGTVATELFTPTLTYLPGMFAPVVQPKNNVSARTVLQRIPFENLSLFGIKKGSSYIDQKYVVIDETNPLGMYYIGSVNGHFDATQTCPVNTSRIWYVDANGPDGDATSIATPAKDLQSVLISPCLQEGDSIKVAEATYYPVFLIPGLSDARDRTFLVTEGIHTIGGYKSDFVEANRNACGKKTILTGNWDKDENLANNSYHVMIWDVFNSKKGTLDGFTIREGNTTGTTHTYIRTNIDRLYGSGFYLNGGLLTLRNATFTGNKSSSLGGGLYAVSGSVAGNTELYAYNVQADSNIAQNGAGFYLNGLKKAQVSHSSFVANTSTGVTSPSYIECGTGIFSFNNPLDITYSTFANNIAEAGVHGIAIYHAGTSVDILRMFHNTVIGNKTKYASASFASSAVSVGNTSGKESPFIFGGNIFAGNENSAAPTQASDIARGFYGSGEIDNRGYNIFSTLGAPTFKVATDSVYTLDLLKQLFKNTTLNNKLLKPILGACYCTPVVYPEDTMSGYITLVPKEVSKAWMSFIYAGNPPTELYDQCNQLLDDSRDYYLSGSVNAPCVKPVADAIADITICNREELKILLTSDHSTTVYDWIIDKNIGLSVELDKWQKWTKGIPKFTVVNTTQQNIVTTIKVVPVYNRCIGDTISFQITVYPTPIVELSAAQVCINEYKTLAPTLTAGATVDRWYSLNPAIASIDATGKIKGEALGATKIWCVVKNTNNCYDSIAIDVTVNAPVTIPAITPASNIVCAKNTVTFSNALAGGTWNTQDSTIAKFIDPKKGELTGVAAGTTTVWYVYDNGCKDSVSASIQVTPLPVIAPITITENKDSICTKATLHLSCATPSGIWSSANNAIATIDASGLVTGISYGVVNMRYSVTGGNACTDSSIVTIRIQDIPEVATPATPLAICENNKIIVTAPTIQERESVVITEGWLLDKQPFNPSITNLVYADNGKKLSYFATTICGTDTSDAVTVRVNAAPIIAEMKAPNAICDGSTLGYPTPSVTYRGVNATSTHWFLAGVEIATNRVFTRADNNKQLYYQVRTTCGNTNSNSVLVTVNAKAKLGTLAPPDPICEYDTVKAITPTITLNGAAITEQGWLLDNVPFSRSTPLSLQDHGRVLRYYVKTACGNDTTNGVEVRVNSRPLVNPIQSPAMNVCVGGELRLRTTSTGAATTEWKSINSHSTIDQAGLLKGISAGESEIRYIATTSLGCKDSVSTYITINALPEVISISGGDSVCSGSPANFNMAFSGSQPFTVILNTGNNNINRQVNGFSLTETINNVTSKATCKVLEIIDANGCRQSYSPALSDSVGVYTLPDVAIKNDTICSGSTAELTLTRVKGKGSLVVSYSLNGTPGYTTTIYDGSNESTLNVYNVTDITLVQITQVQDDNGCTQIYTGTNTRNAYAVTKSLPTVLLTANNTVCEGGKASITFTRGAGSEEGNIAVVYYEDGILKNATILDGANFITLQTDELFVPTEIKVDRVTNLKSSCVTNYILDNGPSKIIAITDLPEVNITSNGDVCIGKEGSVRFTRTVGTGVLVLTYQVNSDIPKTATLNNGQNFVDVSVGNIHAVTSIKLIDVKSNTTSCINHYTVGNEPTVVINPKALPNVAVSVVNTPVCFGATGAFRIATATGQAAPEMMWIYYTINGGVEEVANIAKNTSYTNITLPNITANQTIKIVKVVVNEGCDTSYAAADATVSKTIAVQTLPTITAQNISRTGSGIVDITSAVTTVANHTYTYYSDAACTHPVSLPTMVNVTATRSYWVKMKATTAPFCEAVEEFTVTIISTGGFSLDQEVLAVCVGDEATYTVTLSNGGNTASDMEVEIASGTNLAFVSANAGAGNTYSGNKWTIPNLASGSSTTLTLKYTTLATTPAATLKNTATLLKANGSTLITSDQVRSEKSVIVNSLPTATLYLDNNTICSGNAVTMTLNLTGAAPFSINYNNGLGNVTKSNVSNLYTEVAANVTSARTYTLNSIIDNNGCTTTYTIKPTETVNVNTLPVVKIVPDTVCSGSNAKVIFVREAGAGAIDILYNIQGSPAGSVTIPADRDSASIIVYNVTTRSSVQVTKVVNNECTNTYTGNGPLAYIAVKALPIAVLNVSPSVCNGSNGWVKFVRSGTVGEMTVTYTIGDILTKTATIADGATEIEASIPGITSLTEVKMVSIYDAGTSCTRTYEYGQEPKATIAVKTLPLVNITAPEVVCSGSSAIVNFTRVEGSGKLTVYYSINDANQSTVDVSGMMTAKEFTNITTATYIRIDSIKDANSCVNTYPSGRDSVTINVNPLPDVTVAALENTICKGSVGTFRISNIGGPVNGDMTVYYTLSSTSSSNTTSRKITDGNAYVDIDVANTIEPQTIKITSVINAKGCRMNYPVGTYPTAVIDTASLPVLLVQNLTFTGTGSRNITDAVTDLDPVKYNYSYYTAAGSIVLDPTAENIMTTTNYRVKATTKTSPNCETEKWFTVTVLSTSGFTVEQTVASVCYGDEAIFTVRVGNGTAATATDLEIEDVFGSGLTLTNATASTGTYGSGTWTIPNLASGATASLVLKFTTNSTTEADLKNIATLVKANSNNLTGSDRIKSEVPVVVNALPSATLSLVGSDTICSGTSVNFEMNFLTGKQPFTITSNVTGKGNVNTSITGTTYTETIPSITSKTVYNLLKVTDNNGCIQNYPVGILTDTVFVYTQPEATVADAVVCSGGNATLTFSRVKGVGTMEVFYNVGGVPGYSVQIPTGDNDATAIIPNVSSNTFIQITKVADGNCIRTYNGATATISIKALPTISLAVTSPICTDDKGTITFSRGNGSTTGKITVDYTEAGISKTATIALADNKVDVLTDNITSATEIIVTGIQNAETACEMVYSDNGPIKIISVVDLPEVSIVSAGDVCEGKMGSVQINRLTGTGALEVTYSINDVAQAPITLTNGLNSKIITINNIATATTVKIVKVKAVSRNCENTYTVGNEPTTIINPIALPTATVLAATAEVCSQSASYFTINSTTGNLIVYYSINGVSNTATIQRFMTSVDVNVSNITTNQIFKIHKIISNETGCETSYALGTEPSNTITVSPLPVLNVTNISRTGSGVVDLTTAVVGANGSYTYTYYSNAALTQQELSPTATNVNATKSYWVKVVSDVAPFCENVKEFTVTINSTKGFSIDQEVSAVCLGNDAEFTITLSNSGEAATNLKVTNVAGTNLTYVSASDASYNAGTNTWTIANLASGTSTSITLKYTTTGTTPEASLRNIVTLTEANGNALLALDQVKSEKSVLVNSLPSGALSLDNTTICSGNSVTMTLNLSGASPFSVQYNNGVTVITRNNLSNVYNKTFTDVTANRTFTLNTISDANGCVVDYGIAGPTATVTINTLPTVSIISDDVCTGKDATIKFVRQTGTGALNIFYNIQGVPAGSATIADGDNDVEVTVYDVVMRSSIQVTKVLDNNCANTYSGNGPLAYIDVKPLPTVVLTVSPTVCIGSDGWAKFTRTQTTGTTTVTYVVNELTTETATIADGSNFVNATITNVDGITDIRITKVSYSETGCETVYNNNGPSKTISVIALPEVSIESNGDVCNGLPSSVRITRLAGVGALKVTYNIGGGDLIANLTNGQNSINVSVGNISNATTVTITKVELTSSGCVNTYTPGNEPTTVINPIALPTVSVTVNETTVCSGHNGTFTIESSAIADENLTVYYTINGIPNTATIQKYSQEVTVNVLNITANQVLKVQRVVSAGTGCTTTYGVGTEPTNTITVSPLPVLNVTNISRTGSGVVDLTTAVVGANGSYTYTYYSNAVLTQQELSPTATNVNATKSYWVKVVSDVAPFCENVKEFTVTINSTKGFSIDQEVSAVCLGNDAEFTITLSNSGEAATNLKVTNVAGTNLTYVSASDASYNAGTNTWTIANLASGTSTSITLKYTTTATTPEASLRNIVTLTEANGNALLALDQVKSEKSVLVNSLPSGALSLDNTTICSGNSVTMTLNLSGASPFSVQYNNGVTVITRNNLSNVYNKTFTDVTANRTFTLNTISDANGCVVDYGIAGPTATVTINTLPTVSIISDDVCTGKDATIKFVRQTGTGALNIFYNIQGVPAGSATIADGDNDVEVTVYDVVMRSSIQVTKVLDNNCANTYSGNGPLAYIDVKPLPTVVLTVSPTVCIGSDGWAKFTRTQTTGTTTVTYVVNELTTETATIADGSNFVNATITNVDGITDIRITKVSYSETGCETVYNNNGPSKTISVIALPEVSIESNGDVCNGLPSSVRITRLAGVGALKVTYNIGGGDLIANLTNGQNSINVSVGNISNATTVTITKVELTSSGCVNTYTPGNEPTTVINPIALPTVSVTVNETTVCSGHNGTFTIESSAIADENLTVYYTINGIPNTATIQKYSQEVTVNVLNITANQVLKVQRVVSAGTGCTTTYGVGTEPTNTITVKPSPVANFSTSVVALGKIKFTNTSINGDTYSWDFGDGSPVSTDESPEHLYANTDTYTVKLAVVSANGCTASITKQITVSTSTDLSADFVVNESTQCLENNVFWFTNKSTISTYGYHINNYKWDFGDGTAVETTKNASHTYANAGTYTITLTITETPGGSLDSIKHTIKVLDKPAIADGAAPNAVCEGNKLDVNTPTIDWKGNTPVDGQWLLNGHIFDPIVTPVEAAHNGKTLQYSVTTSCGTTVSTGVTISVNTLPVADFSTSVTGLGKITFTDKSTNATAWAWNFGDGETSNDQNPTEHVYASSGTYTVTLTVTGAGGCTSIISKTVAVSKTTDLEARFDVNEAIQCLDGNTFVFTDKSRINTLNHTISSWSWNFGDGSAAITTQNATHTYTNPGTYTVTLLVTETPGGTQSSVSQTIKVLGIPEITDGTAPVAVCEGSKLQVNMPTIDWKGNTPVNGIWLLDGSIFDPTTPVMAADNGKMLQYRVLTSCGPVISTGTAITVNNTPVADFSTAVTGLGKIKFTDKSTNAATWAWNFGDGESSNIQNPADHVYVNSGTYTVTLTVTNAGGCTSAVSKTIAVSTTTDLEAKFDVNELSQCLAGNTFVFTNRSTITTPNHTISTYDWDFGDGSAHGTTRNATYAYANPGTYTVTLLITETPGGTQSSVTKTIKVVGIPVITDGNVPDAICEGNKLQVNMPTIDWKGNTPVAGTWLLGGSIFDPTTMMLVSSDNGKILQYRITTTCGISTSVGTAVTVKESPIMPSISNKVYCAETEVPQITLGTAVGITYKWRQSHGDNIGLSQLSGTNTIPNFTTENNGIVPLVAYFEAIPFNDNCHGNTIQFSITVNPKATVSSDLAATPICSGSTFSYRIQSESQGAKFSWKRLSNANINNGNVNASTSSIIDEILVNNSTQPIVVKYAIETSTLVCTATSKDTLEVTVNPIPSIANVQNFTYCDGQQVSRFEFTGNIPNATYYWEQTIGGDNNGMPINGTDSLPAFSAINYTESPIISYYKIKPVYTNNGTIGCVGSERTFIITVNPSTTLTSATNMGSICSESRFDYTATTDVSGVTYKWTRSAIDGINNGNETSGNGPKIQEVLKNQTDSAILVAYTFEMSYGTCTTTTDVTVEVLPTPEISIQNIAAVCIGAKEVKFPYTLNASQAQMGLQYSILFDDDARKVGFKNIANEVLGGDTITVQLPAGLIHGYYSATLTLHSPLGCENIKSYRVYINRREDTRIVQQPKAVAICGTDGFTLSVDAVGDPLTYQWYFNSTPIEGATAESYTLLESDSNTHFGNYHVEVTGPCGTVVSDVVDVDRNPLTIIGKWNDVIFVPNLSSLYTSYRWYKDGKPVAVNGASQYYTETNGFKGTYQVSVTFSDGTTQMSCPYKFNNKIAKKSIAIYPNPIVSNQDITINFMNFGKGETENAKVEIFDMGGKELINTTVNDPIQKIKMNLPVGAYVIRITPPSGNPTIDKIIVK